MIEAPDLQLKIAVNPEESFWTELKTKTEKNIDTLKREIIISEAIIRLANEKLNEVKQ